MPSGLLNLRSAREIRLMRQAGLLVWQAHQIVRETIRPGVTTLELDQAIESLFKAHNALPLFLGFPGLIPFPAVTCISVNEAVVHGIPDNRVLESGDVVSVDTGCKVNGWCGDAAATYVVGSIDEATQQLLTTTQRSLQLAIERMPHSQFWSEVAREMQTIVEDAGFSVVKDFVGHGIGREMHEEPQVPNFVSEEFLQEGDFPLRPGLVLAIEPMVNMGGAEVKVLDDQWTQVTADGKLSAHFEHTVALTPSGTVVLTGPPSEQERLQYGISPIL